MFFILGYRLIRFDNSKKLPMIKYYVKPQLRVYEIEAEEILEISDSGLNTSTPTTGLSEAPEVGSDGGDHEVCAKQNVPNLWDE